MTAPIFPPMADPKERLVNGMTAYERLMRDDPPDLRYRCDERTWTPRKPRPGQRQRSRPCDRLAVASVRVNNPYRPSTYQWKYTCEEHRDRWLGLPWAHALVTETYSPPGASPGHLAQMTQRSTP